MKLLGTIVVTVFVNFVQSFDEEYIHLVHPDILDMHRKINPVSRYWSKRFSLKGSEYVKNLCKRLYSMQMFLSYAEGQPVPLRYNYNVTEEGMAKMVDQLYDSLMPNNFQPLPVRKFQIDVAETSEPNIGTELTLKILPCKPENLMQIFIEDGYDEDQFFVISQQKNGKYLPQLIQKKASFSITENTNIKTLEYSLMRNVSLVTRGILPQVDICNNVSDLWKFRICSSVRKSRIFNKATSKFYAIERKKFGCVMNPYIRFRDSPSFVNPYNMDIIMLTCSFRMFDKDEDKEESEAPFFVAADVVEKRSVFVLRLADDTDKSNLMEPQYLVEMHASNVIPVDTSFDSYPVLRNEYGEKNEDYYSVVRNEPCEKTEILEDVVEFWQHG